MTKMATMPMYGKKPFKNLPLQTHKSDDLQTWHTAEGTWPLQKKRLEPYKKNWLNAGKMKISYWVHFKWQAAIIWVTDRVTV